MVISPKYFILFFIVWLLSACNIATPEASPKNSVGQKVERAWKSDADRQQAVQQIQRILAEPVVTSRVSKKGETARYVDFQTKGSLNNLYIRTTVLRSTYKPDSKKTEKEVEGFLERVNVLDLNSQSITVSPATPSEVTLYKVSVSCAVTGCIQKAIEYNTGFNDQTQFSGYSLAPDVNFNEGEPVYHSQRISFFVSTEYRAYQLAESLQKLIGMGVEHPCPPPSALEEYTSSTADIERLVLPDNRGQWILIPGDMDSNQLEWWSCDGKQRVNVMDDGEPLWFKTAARHLRRPAAVLSSDKGLENAAQLTVYGTGTGITATGTAIYRVKDNVIQQVSQQWRYDDEPIGKGEMQWSDGTHYRGDFEWDSINGEGVMEYPDGSRYEGTFFNGYPEGKGILHYPNGTRYEGWFENGKRIKK